MISGSRNAGGHWVEPVSRTVKAPERSGKRIVETQCVKCHGTADLTDPEVRSAVVYMFNAGTAAEK